jgi:hypothetical protein
MAKCIQWCEVNDPGNKVPAWMRRAALAPDGTIYVPAAIAGSETVVVLCASFDGIGVLQDSNHVYVPAKWLKEAYPQAIEVATAIERNTHEFFA